MKFKRLYQATPLPLFVTGLIAFGCSKGNSPLMPAVNSFTTVKVPMIDSKGHVLSASQYTFLYLLMGQGAPMTGSVGPVPSSNVTSTYSFTINPSSTNYDYIALQINDSAAQTVIAVGSEAFTFVAGGTIPVTLGPIKTCYNAQGLSIGDAFGFENNTTSFVGANTSTTTPGLDVVFNQAGAGYAIQNAALANNTVAYMGNGNWVNFLQVPPVSSFYVSSGQSKGYVTANDPSNPNNYPAALGDVYCVKILSGGYAWLQVNNLGGGNLGFVFRLNTSQIYCGYEMSIADQNNFCNGATPTWTNTALATSTQTSTNTTLSTNTSTSTQTPTNTGANTSTSTNTMTASATPTPTNTAGSTSTSTSSMTSTSSPTPTNTAVTTGTSTATMTSTDTATPTNTPLATNTETATMTGTDTATPTDTGVNTLTSTSTLTNTSSATPTNTAGNTSTSSSTMTSTDSATPTNTAGNTATSSYTATNTSSSTPTDTVANTSTVTDTETNTATNTATNTPTDTAINTSTATNSATDTSTDTATPTTTATNSATPSTGVVITFAGTGVAGSANGTGIGASFNYPRDVAVDPSGNLYVADYNNDLIRKISSAGVVSTLAGQVGVAGSADGTGTGAQFNNPAGVAVDSSGNVYVADYGNDTIRLITPAGVVTTLAGQPGIQGAANGPGTSATFNNPTGIAVDGSGNIYVADYANSVIREIVGGTTVSTLAGQVSSPGAVNGIGTAASFNYPTGIALDSAGNVYVADTSNNLIREIVSGTVSTFAGTGTAGSTNGPTSGAQFSNPFAVAVDSSNNVYVADGANNMIREIAGGNVTTLAGQTGSGSLDGVGGAASFWTPYGVAVDLSGNVYVADLSNDLIRKIN